MQIHQGTNALWRILSQSDGDFMVIFTKNSSGVSMVKRMVNINGKLRWQKCKLLCKTLWQIDMLRILVNMYINIYVNIHRKMFVVTFGAKHTAHMFRRYTQHRNHQ